jgi:hypothetical protein
MLLLMFSSSATHVFRGISLTMECQVVPRHASLPDLETEDNYDQHYLNQKMTATQTSLQVVPP